MRIYGEEDPLSVTPDNKEHWLQMRSQNLNSTEISCLFGCNPYMTEFELWHNKKNPTTQQIESNERMEWGNALESAIAHEAARRMGWKIKPFKDYLYLPESRLGSSYDFIHEPNDQGICSTLQEIKNVDSIAYAKNWIEHSGPDSTGLFDIEAPLHIELQIQHQMLVSGMSYAYLCALVGGNSLKIAYRCINMHIQEAILRKAEQFWISIDENKPPKIDYEKDSSFIIDLYSNASKGKSIVAPPLLDELVAGYNTVSSAIKDLEIQKEMFKAKILEQIEDADKVKGDTYTISAGMVAETQVSFTRKSFRNFKITNKKQGEQNAT